MSGNCLFYNESHYYVLMTVWGCIIYTQIVLRKMNVIFCISLFASLAYARALQEFCTFCFHNLHRIGSKYLATSNLSVFLVNVKRILLEKGKSRAEMGDFGAE